MIIERSSYPLHSDVLDLVEAWRALVDRLVELAHADALAEVEAGVGGRPRRRLQARVPLTAVEPGLVLEAPVVTAPVGQYWKYKLYLFNVDKASLISGGNGFKNTGCPVYLLVDIVPPCCLEILELYYKKTSKSDGQMHICEANLNENVL